MGVVGAGKLSYLYGIQVADPNLEILMRHRAVIFGILGALFLYAAFKPHIQVLALAAGFASVISFLVLAYAVGGFNTNIGRVVVADWIALAALVAAAILHWRNRGA